MKKKRSFSWRTKLFVLLLGFAIAPVTAVAYASYETLASTFRESTLAGLQALAQAKAEAVDQFTAHRIREAERIAYLMAPHFERLREAERDWDSGRGLPEPSPELPELEDAEAIGVAPEEDGAENGGEGERRHLEPAPEEVARARDRLRQKLGLLVSDQREFEELLIIDAAGRVVASTYGDHAGRSAANLDYFRHGRRATYIQPIFQSPITEQLTMVIATPMRGESHEEIGVLVARLSLTRFFRLIKDSTGLGATGETVVVKLIDNELVFMAPTRHDAKAALSRRISIDQPGFRALRESARGQHGAGIEVDYRGIEAYKAWQHVPSLDWGLVVKVDQSEAVRGLAEARQRSLLLTLGVVVLVVVASIIAAGSLVRPLRQLREATDRISRGDFAVAVPIRSNDEIGELADSFERMVAAIKFFREHSRSADEEVEPPPDAGEDA